MARTAGVSLGRLLGLSEGAAPVIQPVVVGGLMRASALAAEAPTTPVSPREITVTADVTAVYAIGPPE
jgi:uncharacterized protein YggE